jgi:chemotaxis protein CheD
MNSLGAAARVHGDAGAGQRKSHYDGGAGATAIWIFQGDFYVSARPDLFLTTVLGSCIAVCMRDSVAGCGGMNHFLLPDSENRDDPNLALRYGSYSIERLINAILSRGGRRERLETKVFGGANVIGGTLDVGSRNVDFIEHYFARERLSIKAVDLRGTFPRKLRYFPITGKAQVCELRDRDAAEVIKSEADMRAKMAFSKLSGDIEVFPHELSNMAGQNVTG